MNEIELFQRLTRIEDLAASTERQAKATNGHVADAFREINYLKQWKTGLLYAWSFALIVIVPILALSLYKVWSSDAPDMIQKAVAAGVTEAIKNAN